MKILNITGPQGAGKTVVVEMLSNRYGGLVLRDMPATVLRRQLKDLTSVRSNNLFIDFDRSPSPALEKYVIQRAEEMGVEHLVLARSS